LVQSLIEHEDAVVGISWIHVDGRLIALHSSLAVVPVDAATHPERLQGDFNVLVVVVVVATRL
jgi:hypothetical protein